MGEAGGAVHRAGQPAAADGQGAVRDVCRCFAKRSTRCSAPLKGSSRGRCVRLCLPKSTARRPRCWIRRSLPSRRCLRGSGAVPADERRGVFGRTCLSGHSIGEISGGACGGGVVAGGCEQVGGRARAADAGLPGGGAMLAVAVSEAELVPTARAVCGPHVDVAAVNGPQSAVVSGDEDAVLAVGGTSRRRVDGSSRLRVSHAFHSRRMERDAGGVWRVAAGSAVAASDGADHLECDRQAGQRGRADDRGVLGAARAPERSVL